MFMTSVIMINTTRLIRHVGEKVLFKRDLMFESIEAW